MWLLNRLVPDFKMIADFRKDNGEAIKAVCRKFMMICRRLDLFAESLIVIDGSRFKAVNNRNRNYIKAKVKRRIEAINSVPGSISPPSVLLPAVQESGVKQE
jgi:transposase